MFLILPSGGEAGDATKPGFNVVAPQEAPAETRSRTRKACNRCRLKKTKCNGRIPCARCERDHATCIADPCTSDVQQWSRSYITSLEAQQISLLTALRELYRQAPDNSAIRDTIEQLQRKGFDVNSLEYKDQDKALQTVQPSSGRENLGIGPSSGSWDYSDLSADNLQSLLAQSATPQSVSDFLYHFGHPAEQEDAHQGAQQEAWEPPNTYLNPSVQNTGDMVESFMQQHAQPLITQTSVNTESQSPNTMHGTHGMYQIEF